MNGLREEAIVDWGYNAWGGKYPPFEDDDVIPTKIAEEFGIPVYHPGIVMEGGSLDVNGAGTLLTTESCLLNPNRNPSLTREEIERYLKDYLGVRHILWLGDGIVGDDTDGHVDDLSRFTDPSTIVTAVELDSSDENYRPLKENLDRLRGMRDQDGNPFRIVTLPMPPAGYYEGQRLPASYANFYIANGVVLLPAYDPTTDEIARQTLQRCFSDPPGHPARLPGPDLGAGVISLCHAAMASRVIGNLKIGRLIISVIGPYLSAGARQTCRRCARPLCWRLKIATNSAGLCLAWTLPCQDPAVPVSRPIRARIGLHPPPRAQSRSLQINSLP